MCSNTSSGGGGGGSGGDNDGGNGGGDSIYSKKHRRQKVPKRGPGVAELEKILREQENSLVLPLMAPPSNNSSNYILQSSSNLSSSASSCSLPVITSVSSSLSPNIKHFNGGKSSGIWNSNCEVNNNNGENGSGKIGGTRFQLLPLNGSSSSQIFGSNNLMHTARQHSPPSTKNLFPNNNNGGGMSSSITTLSGPGHGREPPSNQKFYRHSTLWPEEDKMVGEKRGRSFAMEIPPVPPFRYHIPTFSAQMNMNRLDTPFPCDSRTLFNFDPTDYTISREMRQTTRLEPNKKKQHIEDGESESNFVTFPSPTTPPSLIHSPNIFNPFPFQENNGDLQHNFGINHHHHQGGGSVTKKPFYSFLPPREKLGISEGLNTERVETRGDVIDLDLRL